MKMTTEELAKTIPNLSRSELLNLKTSIDGDMDHIKYQVKMAEAHQKETGEYADPKWYWAARSAKKIKARQSQMIQAELTRRKKRKRVDINSAFVEVARRRMDEDAFRDFMAEALDDYHQDQSPPP